MWNEGERECGGPPHVKKGEGERLDCLAIRIRLRCWRLTFVNRLREKRMANIW